MASNKNTLEEHQKSRVGENIFSKTKILNWVVNKRVLKHISNCVSSLSTNFGFLNYFDLFLFFFEIFPSAQKIWPKIFETLIFLRIRPHPSRKSYIRPCFEQNYCYAIYQKTQQFCVFEASDLRDFFVFSSKRRFLK